jgi:hypothetical protein
MLVAFLSSYVAIAMVLSYRYRVKYVRSPDEDTNDTVILRPVQPTMVDRIVAGVFWLPALLVFGFFLITKRIWLVP